LFTVTTTAAETKSIGLLAFALRAGSDGSSPPPGR
jgi:hypothetical protein